MRCGCTAMRRHALSRDLLHRRAASAAMGRTDHVPAVIPPAATPRGFARALPHIVRFMDGHFLWSSAGASSSSWHRGPLHEASAQPYTGVRHDLFFHEADMMTDPIEQRPSDHPETPSHVPHAAALPDPVAPPQTVQQLRDAGFSNDEQAALTTAFLRVLALWTQQATRDDLHTALRAGEQQLAQQLDALREEFRRELTQHAEAVREELRSTQTWQADVLATTRAAPPRRWDVPPWLLTALLGLTCAGVLLLVVARVLGW